MKNLVMIFALAIFGNGIAQVKTPQPSPKAVVNQTVGLTDIEIEYSRPGMKNRAIFGDLVPFAKMWRTGANANSTISFSDNVTIGGKELKKGKYSIFTVPKADMWEIIFYTTLDNWGTPENFDESKVALRTTAKPELTTKNIENFTLAITSLDNNYGILEISWEKTVVSIKIEVPTQKNAMASITKTLAGPGAGDYFSAAQFFLQSNGDTTKALEYVNKALELNAEKPFWYNRLKSLIQAKLGDKTAAIETAKISMAAAETAKNSDYVKMNKDSIAEWSKK